MLGFAFLLPVSGWAVSAALVELPDPLTHTKNVMHFRVTLGPTELHLLSARVTAEADGVVEVMDSMEANLPTQPPYVFEADLVAHFDSTHWRDGKTVTFKVYGKAFAPFGGPPVENLLMTTERTVHNKATLVWDESAMSNSLHWFDAKLKLTENHYTSANSLRSTTWTRDEYLTYLPAPTVHYVLTHGGCYGSNPPTDGFLIPPGGGGNVNASHVAGAVPGSTPYLKFAYIAGCGTSIGNTSLAQAYLAESTDPWNRAVIAFKISPDNVWAQAFWITLWDFVWNAGMTVRDAAIAAFETDIKPHLDDANEQDWQFDDVMVLVGDPKTRLRYVYDGTDLRHKAWKINP